MRLLYLAIYLMLPHISLAQIFGFSPFESGSYVLTSSPAVRIKADLKLKNGSLLIIKNAAGKKTEFVPQQVVSFVMGTKKYISATGFKTQENVFSSSTTKFKFVELIDSGQIILMRYTHFAGNGSGPYGAGGSEINEYLLRRSNDSTPTLIETNWRGSGTQFREGVRPYLVDRPDLVKLLDEKRITIENLREAVHALNTGQPF